MSYDNSVVGTEPTMSAANRVGLYSSILTVVVTLVTFGLAITAIPTWTRYRSSPGITCGCHPR